MSEVITLPEKIRKTSQNAEGDLLITEIPKQPSKYAQKRAFPLWEGEGPPPVSTVPYRHDGHSARDVAKRPSPRAARLTFPVDKDEVPEVETLSLADLPPIPESEKGRTYSEEEVGWLLGISGDPKS